MSNPMNCETCDYKHFNKKQLEADNAHCYMFREAPTEICRVHTGFKELSPLIEADIKTLMSMTSFADIVRGMKHV